jgi:hypothetical protein
MMKDPCEWNPTAGRAALSNEESHAEATRIVGARDGWRLCEACSQLPEFKRRKKELIGTVK